MMIALHRLIRQGPSASRLLPAAISFVDSTTFRFLGSVKRDEKKSKGEASRPRDLEVILSALDAPTTKPPPGTADEQTRRECIRKAYTIVKFKQHNQDNHDITCKLKMKQHALKMLPKNSKLKEKALEIDDSGPPRWRRIPAWTPPIPGFNPNQFTLTEE
jgi:Mitochondrial ribosomal protein L28